MVPDSVRLGFTAEIPLPNQGFSARFLVERSEVNTSFHLTNGMRSRFVATKSEPTS